MIPLCTVCQRKVTVLAVASQDTPYVNTCLLHIMCNKFFVTVLIMFFLRPVRVSFFSIYMFLDKMVVIFAKGVSNCHSFRKNWKGYFCPNSTYSILLSMVLMGKMNKFFWSSPTCRYVARPMTCCLMSTCG
jgi:hypothetical protein